MIWLVLEALGDSDDNIDGDSDSDDDIYYRGGKRRQRKKRTKKKSGGRGFGFNMSKINMGKAYERAQLLKEGAIKGAQKAKQKAQLAKEGAKKGAEVAKKKANEAFEIGKIVISMFNKKNKILSYFIV